jgi:integrase
MSAEIIEILQKLQKSKGQSKYIFTNPFQPGQPIKWNVYRDFAKIVVKAGLVDEEKKPLYSLHDLRRTFVTDMLTIGSDPKVLQTMTGHQDLETLFRHYAAVRAKKAASDIDKRSRYLNGE